MSSDKPLKADGFVGVQASEEVAKGFAMRERKHWSSRREKQGGAGCLAPAVLWQTVTCHRAAAVTRAHK